MQCIIFHWGLSGPESVRTSIAHGPSSRDIAAGNGSGKPSVAASRRRPGKKHFQRCQKPFSRLTALRVLLSLFPPALKNTSVTKCSVLAISLRFLPIFGNHFLSRMLPTLEVQAYFSRETLKYRFNLRKYHMDLKMSTGCLSMVKVLADGPEKKFMLE